jgi:hypothetical protein
LGRQERLAEGSGDRGCSIGEWEISGVDNKGFVTTKVLLIVTKKSKERVFGFERFALAAPWQ